ncbi:MAG: DUF1592 domain-containing protein [Planctomycetota bacterium]
MHVSSGSFLALAGIVVSVAAGRSPIVHAPAPEDDVFAKTIEPIVRETCIPCHGPDQQKAGFRLDELDPDFITGGDDEAWSYVVDLVRHGEMPPSKHDRQLADDERRAIVEWIDAGLEAAARANEGEVGPVLRRLNRAQYTHTLQELLHLDIDFGSALPGDARSKTGFTNNGEVLQASALHIETYEEIARAALAEAIALGPRPESTRYRVRFGEDIGRGRVAGRTGGYQSVPLNTDDFVVEIAGTGGKPKDLERLDVVAKKISVGLRGSQQNRFRVTEDGLALYGAVPHKEVAPGAWQGPSPNVKLEMQRVFPERGDVMMRVTARRGAVWRSREPVLLQLEDDAPVASLADDGALKLPANALVARADASDQRGNVVMMGDVVVAEDVTEPSNARVRFSVPVEGYYRVDLVHPPVPAAEMPSVRITYAGKTLDSRPVASEDDLVRPLIVSNVGAAYMRAGKQHVKVGGPFFPGFRELVLTPLDADHELVRELGEKAADLEARYADVDPVLRVFAGTRTDDGMDYRTFGEPAVVNAPGTYAFLGRLEDLPIPEPDSGDTEILSGFLLLGLWNDSLVKDRRSPGPPLLVESIEVEAPYHPVWPPASHTAIFDPKLASDDEEEHARAILTAFAARAFRDPGVRDDVDLYLDYWREIRDEFDGFEESLVEPLVAVLCSPRFLYLVEADRSDAPDEPLTQEALANRLSYFLWNGPPDDALRNAALFGTLNRDLEAQVDRMLDDPRARRFVEQFAHEWLRLDRFETMTIDADRFPAFTRFVKRDMREETLAFVHRVFAEDLSLFTLVDSDFAMLNQNLAEFYGIEGVVGPHVRAVEVPREKGRGGLLSQGAFLAGHSDGLEPHPIKRAVWLKERLLGDPPPPPPPNVPDLDAEAPEMQGLTLKEQIALHRDSASCRDCHASFDAYGIAFERYSAVGLIEDERRGKPIDARVELPDGTRVDGVVGLKEYLAGPASDAFIGSVVEHVFAYALGRDVSYRDEETLEAIAERVANEGYSARALVKAIVDSDAFRR